MNDVEAVMKQHGERSVRLETAGHNEARRMIDKEQGPVYKAVSAALDEAHAACFKHPDRGPIGMSHGPFSGVNFALGAVAALEKRLEELVVINAELRKSQS